MNITVVGVGYVGLVTGTCFAEMGNKVYCVDVDEKKIQNLKNGKIPIYEPGLDSMVESNFNEGRLIFTTSLKESMEDSDVYFIAVGTPMADDGSANLKFVFNVAKEIGENLKDYAVVVDKSTVPVGTAEKVHGIISQELEKRGVDIPFDVVSNPEFLKEGNAIDDFMKPDRIIVGTDSEEAEKVMRDLYSAFSMHHDKFIHMGVRDAEMTKYTANAMLATKISFMNEISNICDRLEVDVENVRRGIGSDSRIGYSFIYPGVGYGGSCFPKDVSALVKLAQDTKFEPILLKSVTERNHEQKSVLFKKIIDHYGEDLSGHTFGMWGLAFKPGTDDLREAPSRVLIEKIVGAGGSVKAFDPVAMENASEEFPASWFDSGQVELIDDQYQALKDTDALVLVTEWKQFRRPDFEYMKTIMKKPVIFDGRNQYSPDRLKEDGYEYFGIGRK